METIPDMEQVVQHGSLQVAHTIRCYSQNLTAEHMRRFCCNGRISKWYSIDKKHNNPDDFKNELRWNEV